MRNESYFVDSGMILLGNKLPREHVTILIRDDPTSIDPVSIKSKLFQFGKEYDLTLTPVSSDK